MNVIKYLIVWLIILQIWIRCCKDMSRGQAGKFMEREEVENWRMSAPYE